MLGVDDLHRLIGDDAGRRDDAALVPIDADDLGMLARVLDHEALDVEDDVGHVFNDAGNRRDLVLHALYLHPGHGAAFKAGEQDTPQTVADRHAEAAFKRLGRELAVGVGQGVAVAHHAIGQLQTPPSDTHE